VPNAVAHIEVLIDVDRPVELVDFVSAFTALASQFDRFIRQYHPDLSGEAQIFVKEVRPGSFLADLIPFALSVIGHMDQILIVEDFLRRYGGRLGQYFSLGGRAADATKIDLRDFMGTVRAIANSPNGKSALRAVAYQDGKRDIRFALEFDTAQAIQATQELENHRKELEGQRDDADHENVLMTFYQSNLRDTSKTGEKVIIEAVSPKPLAIIYASDLARQRIKSEIAHGERNVFRLGFLVDVNVETLRGRPVAYRVVNVRDVIDLPQDE
jgi:hypothetical protein